MIGLGGRLMDGGSELSRWPRFKAEPERGGGGSAPRGHGGAAPASPPPAAPTRSALGGCFFIQCEWTQNTKRKQKKKKKETKTNPSI